MQHFNNLRDIPWRHKYSTIFIMYVDVVSRKDYDQGHQCSPNNKYWTNIVVWNIVIQAQSVSTASLTGRRDTDQCENGSLVNFSSIMPFAWHTWMLTSAALCSRSSPSTVSWTPPLKRKERQKITIHYVGRFFGKPTSLLWYYLHLVPASAQTLWNCMCKHLHKWPRAKYMSCKHLYVYGIMTFTHH